MRLAVDRRCRSAALRDPAAARQHPVAVVVEVAVERLDRAVGDEPQRVGRRAQQVPVVRDDELVKDFFETTPYTDDRWKDRGDRN